MSTAFVPTFPHDHRSSLIAPSSSPVNVAKEGSRPMPFTFSARSASIVTHRSSGSLLGASSLVTEADGYLFNFFHTGQPNNRSHVSYTRLDDLLDAQRRYAARSSRKKIIDEIQRHAAAQVYYLYTPYPKNVSSWGAVGEELRLQELLRSRHAARGGLARQVAGVSRMPWRARTPGMALSLTVFAAHIFGDDSRVY
jgi:ABC-type transport system substrate-binding protein